MKRAAGNRVSVSNLHRFLRFSPDETRKLVRSVLSGEHASGWTVGVAYVPDQQMRKLNLQYKNSRRSTDVLAFEYESGQLHEGEVVVCLDQARRQAPAFNATYSEEVARLIIHGVLHLMGYDDRKARAKDKMIRKEEFYLRKLYARTRR